MATPTIKIIQDNAADYMHAVLQKAQSGRLKPHEANVAAAVMAGYFTWTEAISKRELVERAAGIIEMGRVIREQGEAHIAKVEQLLALSRASKTNRRRKTPTPK